MDDQSKRHGAIRTVEMHTGGECVRIIVSGFPPIEGETILEQGVFVKNRLDHLRTMLMAEPRGHTDMYGALLVKTTDPQADLAAIFMYNGGYSTMCGHATISLGRYAVDYKLVEPVSPETKVVIQCACGLVTVYVEYDSKTCQSGSVRFQGASCYAVAVDKTVTIDGLGAVKYDVGYGGGFYILADVNQLKMNLETTPVAQLIEAGVAIKEAVKSEVKLTHPDGDEMAFYCGTLLTDGDANIANQDTAKNLLIFGNHQVDRSPCGAGTSTRTSVLFHKGVLKLGDKRRYVNGKTGSVMTAMPVRVEPYDGHEDAVIVEVSGHGYYTGEATFWMEEGDVLGKGFLVS